MSTPTVLVGLDGVADSPSVLAIASALAEIEGALLHLLSLDRSLRSEVIPGGGGSRAAAPSRVPLTEIVLPHDRVDLADEILRVADRIPASLLVLGTWFGTRYSHGRLSPLAEQIVRRARLPLVLVRAGERVGWRPERILLPHDGTPTTAAAVLPASDLALRSGAELLVVHIATEMVGRPIEAGTFQAPRYLDQLQHEWPSWTAEFLERMYALGHQHTPLCAPKLALRAGEPGKEIIRFAEEYDVDLIVLAWSGHWARKRAATLKAVIRGARCPVLILRADTGVVAG